MIRVSGALNEEAEETEGPGKTAEYTEKLFGSYTAPRTSSRTSSHDANRLAASVVLSFFPFSATPSHSGACTRPRNPAPQVPS